MANVTLIPDDYDTLKKEYIVLRKELECANQELYGCKRQLKIVEALQNEYQSEIESLQSEQNIEKQKWEEKVLQLEETISNIRLKYNERIQALEADLSKKEEENETLHAKIELMKKVNTTHPVEDNHKLTEELVALKEDKEILLEKEEELKLSLEILQKKYLALEETLVEYKDELSHLKENFVCKREELSEANDLIQKLNDEIFCLKSELESFKSRPLNEQSKGNSLFAEVDDRRVYLQKTINSMKAEYISMKQERARHIDMISQLRNEIRGLYNRWKADLEEKEDDQDMVLKAYKDRVQICENVMEKYKRDLAAKPLVLSTGSFSEVEFYQCMLNDKVKEIEELRNQLLSRGLTHVLLSTSLKEANREIRMWRLEAKQCHVDLKSGGEKLDEVMENRNLEPKHMKKGPNLACKREDKSSSIKVQVSEESRQNESQEVITINDSNDSIVINSEDVKELKTEAVENSVKVKEELVEEVDDQIEETVLENKENLADSGVASGKPVKKLTFSHDAKEEIVELKADGMGDCVKVKENPDEEVEDPIEETVLENKENMANKGAASGKPAKKLTFSKDTVSPKMTDRTAMKRNCRRLVVPKPIYIPSD